MSPSGCRAFRWCHRSAMPVVVRRSGPPRVDRALLRHPGKRPLGLGRNRAQSARRCATPPLKWDKDYLLPARTCLGVGRANANRLENPSVTASSASSFLPQADLRRILALPPERCREPLTPRSLKSSIRCLRCGSSRRFSSSPYIVAPPRYPWVHHSNVLQGRSYRLYRCPRAALSARRGIAAFRRRRRADVDPQRQTLRHPRPVRPDGLGAVLASPACRPLRPGAGRRSAHCCRHWG